MSGSTFSTGGFDKVKALGKSVGTVAPRKKDDWVSRLLVSRRGSTKSKVAPGLISWCSFYILVLLFICWTQPPTLAV